MEFKDFPTSTVIAASFGALLAALRGGVYTYKQRLVSFITGFAAAIYLAPYLCERIGVTSDTGKNSIVFLVGYLAITVMPKISSWVEQRVPEFLDVIFKRTKNDKEN